MHDDFKIYEFNILILLQELFNLFLLFFSKSDRFSYIK